MKTTDHTCSTCRHWRPQAGDTHDPACTCADCGAALALGDCHAAHPVVLVVPAVDPTGRTRFVTTWPATAPVDDCGEYAPTGAALVAEFEGIDVGHEQARADS